MVVRIYVEGGGHHERLKRACRRGFGKLLEKSGFEGRMPRIVASGSRKNAFENFCSALTRSNSEEFHILLVDSEGPVTIPGKPWEHLRETEKWEIPMEVTDENAHLMVECMETWFLADLETLKDFYGQGFLPGSLPQNPKIEEVPKRDLLQGLYEATRSSNTKGKYSKGRHSFAILENINPEKLCAASPHAKRFIDTLREKLTGDRTR